VVPAAEEALAVELGEVGGGVEVYWVEHLFFSSDEARSRGFVSSRVCSRGILKGAELYKFCFSRLGGWGVVHALELAV